MSHKIQIYDRCLVGQSTQNNQDGLPSNWSIHFHLTEAVLCPKEQQVQSKEEEEKLQEEPMYKDKKEKEQ